MAKPHKVPANLPVIASAAPVLDPASASPEAVWALLQQLVASQARAQPSPNLKYAFEYFKIGSELMDVFSSMEPIPFTKAACKGAPPFGGVYFVFRKASLIYVGRTDHLRRRLRQHFGGRTTFAQAVIGRFRPPKFAEFVADNFTIVFRELEDASFRRALEHVAIGVFQPVFNTD